MKLCWFKVGSQLVYSKLMLMRQEGGLDLLTHPELLAPLIRDFDRRSGDVFTKCSMALDGVAIKLQCPRVNGAAYYCRKGFHSFNVQVICDSNHTISRCSIQSRSPCATS